MPHSILLVEDNPMDVDLTQRALARCNLNERLHVARDGEEALAWISKWDAGEPRPAFIMLDLNLPKVNGLDVLRTLKSHPVYKTIPVIVHTTSMEDGDLHAAYMQGANSYIVKPADFESFVSIVERIQIYWATTNTPE